MADPDKPSAASRFEEEDRLRPEPDDPRRRPEVPKPGNKYAWAVGVLGLMLIAVLYLANAQKNQGKGILGPKPGQTLPAFAAPLATGNFTDDADSNVFQTRSDARSRGEHQSACDVRARYVLNSCELREHPSVITFLVTKGADCEPQVDRVERMRRDFPQVRFSVVMSGDKLSEVRRIASNRRWTLPVGVDKDGAVQNLYGNGVCPTTVFSNARGKVTRTVLGNLSEGDLRADTRKLLRPAPPRR